MRLVSSEQENIRFKLIKPYLKLVGVQYVLDEEKAPENIKQAYEEYLDIRERALKEALKADGII